MVMVMAAATGADRLGKILQVRKLTGLGSIGEIGRQLVELVRRAGISLRLSRLRRALQVVAICSVTCLYFVGSDC